MDFILDQVSKEIQCLKGKYYRFEAKEEYLDDNKAKKEEIGELSEKNE